MGNIKSLDMAAESLVYTVDGTAFTVSYSDLFSKDPEIAEKWNLLAELELPFESQFGPTTAEYDGKYLVLSGGGANVVLEVGVDYDDEVRDSARSFVSAARAELAV